VLPEVGPEAAIPGRQPLVLARASRTNYTFHASYLELNQKIVLEGEVIGSIYLKSPLADPNPGWEISEPFFDCGNQGYRVISVYKRESSHDYYRNDSIYWSIGLSGLLP
jgi:hypothetical protein